jgi:hypothetical protein
MDLHALFKVKIDFASSHMVFPHVIEAILAVLLVLIVATRWRRIAVAVTSGPVWPIGIDKVRFFGTLVLTTAYFLAMPVVGDLRPNTGIGFLLASIPYMMAISVLYLHDRRPRQLVHALLSALIGPSIVWLVLSRLFNITLP